ncbi:hypothetical protein V6N13_066432 [Hibiscus sabdariffa]|uniref:Uncharacterized protein n=1 Tax=Hibiscus sabdariffa TaxID=183260 RepID=A0ABR2DQE3_9ROSI
MGRAPCCDKANVKKGPWSPEEDAKLKSYMEKYGTRSNWIALPQKIGLKRCGKSCRLRWLNYLRPNIKHGGFSEEEDNIICNLYLSIGSSNVKGFELDNSSDNLIDSETAVEVNGNGHRGMVRPVSNFKAELVEEFLDDKACGYAPQCGKLAQFDGFNNKVNDSKESMIWWSNEFAANPASSNCWGTSTSVVQFNEMFQNFDFGYNV